MTVSNYTPLSITPGAGIVLAPIAVPAPFYNDSDIKVYFIDNRPDALAVETLLIKDTDYTMSKAAVAGTKPRNYTGNISVIGAVPFACSIAVMIDPVNSQTSDLSAVPFSPMEYELGFDLSVMRDAALREIIKRSIRLSLASTAIGILFPSPSPLKVIGWNAAGKLTNLDPQKFLNLAGAASAAQGLLAETALQPDDVIGYFARYQVQKDGTILGPDKKRFVAVGKTMFDSLFVSYEVRSNYLFRETQDQYPPDSGATFPAGVSRPTFHAHVAYKSAANAEKLLRDEAAIGVNCIRIAVEPAMMAQTSSYVIDGVTYPPDFIMLDTIISTARNLGMVVVLVVGNDLVPSSLNESFLVFLGSRYKDQANVWIKIINEVNCYGGPGGSTVNCDNASVWYAENKPYLQALRSSGFLNPALVGAPHYDEYLDSIVSYLDGDVAFSQDPNLVVSVHLYASGGAMVTFKERLPVIFNHWVKYVGKYCIMIDEAGFTPDGDVVDTGLGRPDILPPVAVSSLQHRLARYAYLIDELTWLRELMETTSFSGAIGFSAYWPSPTEHILDFNTMRFQDGSLTNWGEIFRDYFSAPKGGLSASSPGTGDDNYLINPTMRAVNQRGFNGGNLAAGNYGFDMWGTVGTGANVTLDADGSINLKGFLQQSIMDHNLAGEIVTVSIPDVGLIDPTAIGADPATEYVNVFVGSTADVYRDVIALPVARGRQSGSVRIPASHTGPIVVTLQSSTNGVKIAAHKGLKFQSGMKATDHVPRKLVDEQSLCYAYYQSSDASEKQMIVTAGGGDRLTKTLRQTMHTVPVVFILTGNSTDNPALYVFALANSSKTIMEFGLFGPVGQVAVWTWAANASPALV